MKKALKITGIVVLTILAILIIFLLGLFIYHKIMLKKEESLLDKPLGQMVEVDGHKMSVYTQGDGEHTLVFMSGYGAASPILNFKPVLNLLNNDYKVVVLERFGYGFSDVVDGDRSFETMLRQDREALSKAGINGTYILCPESISGLEALLWEQAYPDEVEAIVGLDMAVPKDYDGVDTKQMSSSARILSIAREMGLARLIVKDGDAPEWLTKEEIDIYKALIYKKYYNKTVLNEEKGIHEACEKIKSNSKPVIPMLMFVSNGKGTPVENWKNNLLDYASSLSNATVIELDSSHDVVSNKSEQIAENIKVFINKLDANRDGSEWQL